MSIDGINGHLSDMNVKMDLPWTTVYSQAGSSETTSSEEATTPLEYWALALTVIFIVAVYAFEGYLDTRQKSAYKVTTFPKQLQVTVSKIDTENGDTTPLLPQLEDKFQSSQSYGLDKINFGMISSTYDTLEAVAFLLLGFLPYTWDTAVSLGQDYFGYSETENEIKVTLIFLSLVTLVGTVTALPFELVRTESSDIQVETYADWSTYTCLVCLCNSIRRFRLKRSTDSTSRLLDCSLPINSSH